MEIGIIRLACTYYSIGEDVSFFLKQSAGVSLTPTYCAIHKAAGSLVTGRSLNVNGEPPYRTTSRPRSVRRQAVRRLCE